MTSHRHFTSAPINGGESTNSVPANSIEFDLLTYAELSEEIRAAAMRANNAVKRDAWCNLLKLAEGAAGEDKDAWDPTQGQPWSLLSLEMEGFQGATRSFSVQFDPTPGITIFHGPNGSGKSTIADGIRTAISGTTDWWAAVTPGKARSGKSPLWEKVNCARDSDSATVKVILARANETLTISGSLGKDGIVNNVGAYRAQVSGEEASVLIGSTSWPYAVESHPPVFSYADVERRVQQHEDLQKYIKNLLALGGCFDSLDAKVAALSASASNSSKKLTAAQRSAMMAVAAVDEKFRDRDPSCSFKEVAWNDAISDMSVWLDENDLTDHSAQVAEVTESSHQKVIASLGAVDRALEELHGNHPGIHNRLSGPLHALYSEVEIVAEPGYSCPVCDSETEDWVDRLRVNVASVQEIQVKRKTASDALTELRRFLPDILSTIEILTQGNNLGESELAFVTDVRNVASELSTAFDTHGAQPVATVVSCFLRLRDRIMRDEWGKAASSAIELSNFTRQWQRSRRAALDPYVSVWFDEHEEALSAPLWEATKKCIGDLSDRLMKERAARFEGRASLQVKKLLEDAGISLESLNLTRKRAEIEVQGSDGRPMELAMLSAGQRNAFLLAPLFATADAGPFGFLVLDDPVHSFDEIRVDRLAAVISDLAQSRRVIVLTHDERLKEHLLARSSRCEAHTVSRDTVTGEINVQPTDELWRVLIEDARSVWQWSPKPSPTGYLTESQIIRGLLRQALDDALRQCVVKYALKTGVSVSEAVQKLDSGLTTQNRMKLAQEIISLDPVRSHPVERALQACSHHLRKWNNAAHGHDENKPDLKREIEAGQEACSHLGEFAF
ncbi:AAA family ATPase [Streptomyces sp. NPDC060187]|uniref:ATP-binding protein n=1 Tax=Streptomyces sp. NPDC060187 TaxID=3347067 RepID=UPI00364E1878